MKLQYLMALAVLLWGAQSDLLLFAVPIAIILEARHFVNVRWALTKQDFYRVADLTAICLIGMIVFLFVNRADYHFITTLIKWMPILFSPLVVVLAYSTTGRMPLDVLFYSLRRQKEPVTQSWDMDYVLFGMCLVAAGANTSGGSFIPGAGEASGTGYYFVCTSALVLTALYRLRSPRYARNAWLLIALLVFLAANVAQQAMRGGHLKLKQQTREWIANYIRDRTNPLRSNSAIGDIGRLKVSDEILFRVEGIDIPSVPRLMTEATYDLPSDENNWMVINPEFSVVPQVADFTWRFHPPGDEHRARVYLEFQRETDLVPVPSSTTRIFDLPATHIKQSRFGSIQGNGMVASPGFELSYRAGETLYSEPTRTDLLTPGKYDPVLDSLIANAGGYLSNRPVATINEIFRDFRYSVYQNLPLAADPLTWFLTQARAGHCEYFATSTVLLLRRLGIPARYAVGYSVQEYDESIDMYVVRQRHAHAWAVAWIDNEWQVVDTTPSVWLETEAAQSGFLRPITDLFANANFLFQLWWSKQKLEDYETELYVIGALLVLLLIWRIATSEQVRLDDESGESAKRERQWPGTESPFYAVEAELGESGLLRGAAEPMSTWLHRIGNDDLLPLLQLHNRWRFDPDGLNDDQKAELGRGVERWLAAKASQETS